MNDFELLAGLLFPNVTQTPEDLERQYPPRTLPEGARVTRFAPSPTGHMHLGNLFSALIDERVAHTCGGVFYLRVEDTDKKREIENGIEGILSDLAYFGLTADEGAATGGQYGPYRQRQRADIYHVYARFLTAQGLAYPCFCTEEDLSVIRREQEESKITPGYYGAYARCRTLSLAEIREKLDAETPYVLRLRSPGTEDGKVAFDDLIKGRIEMPENIQDIVLLKSDGIPTYHFAHAVDDHLMRTTHVIRGDEWIASTPIHLQLFRLLGMKPPKYCHISPLMKEENGGKRKLSKRKDPELGVTYYIAGGYPAESVREYMLTLANSNFEDWRRANPDASCDDFPFAVKKMSPSGAIFDLVKLNDVSKNVIARMSAGEVYRRVCAWAQEFDPEFFSRISADPAFGEAVFAVDRGGKKPRKDLARWSDAVEYTRYYFSAPAEYESLDGTNLTPELTAAVCESYIDAYQAEEDKDAWFNHMKQLCMPLGMSPDVKAYKASPDDFTGHVGDFSTAVRVAVTGRRNTPDLYEILRLLKKDEVIRRLRNAITAFRQQ